MSSRRSKFELALDLLNVIQEGETKPTRIMYKANLSWRSLNDVIQQLVQSSLVEEQVINRRNRSIKRYNITEKGRSVLRYYSDLARLIKTEDINLDL